MNENKPKIMWRVSGETIYPVLVVKETACYITYKSESCNGILETRESRENFFSDFDFAKRYIMDSLTARIGWLEAEVHRLKYKKQKTNNMKQPEVPAWMK